MSLKRINEKRPEILPESNPTSLDEVADIELEFEKADVELLKHQVQLFNPLYEKRANVLRKIPKFWPIALEAAPSDEFSVYINPEDANVLEHLIDLRVYRPNEDPRDIKIVFEFEPNEYLESNSLYLEKLFRYSSQKAEASSSNTDKEPSQLISEKVNIKWKKNKDLTKPTKGVAPSFFTWFLWTGENNDIFEDGEELAIFIAEDLYPNAVKYFTDALQENEENDDEEIDLENENGDNISEEEPPKKKTRL
ncbi:hypothetical protein PNEG_02154 [Pneumocystis murina B123]|uniref:Uncharacterized protein n=1 Tax=Pneumocystis murina (strain B123) TaxID=1069680 RepID=M7NLM6_PNEMU|nr:hypothetical protein PNEG_02154 [Pneumocystis murina B123]EMR09568.1 hypothetical protein PNEG_02154 [Pneumocystis murina B123]